MGAALGVCSLASWVSAGGAATPTPGPRGAGPARSGAPAGARLEPGARHPSASPPWAVGGSLAPPAASPPAERAPGCGDRAPAPGAARGRGHDERDDLRVFSKAVSEVPVKRFVRVVRPAVSRSGVRALPVPRAVP